MSGIDAYLSVQSSGKKQLKDKTHLEFVKRIARSFKNKIPQSISIDDLNQVGLIALMDIYEKYDASQNKTLENFASKRIRGAMIDLIRENTPISKEKIAIIKKGQRFIDDYTVKYGFEPKERTVAEFLGLTLQKYQAISLEYQSVFIVNIDDVSIIGAEVLSAENLIDLDKTKSILISSLKMLSDREQQLISLYFIDELTQLEIANILSITESRVSQMLKNTLAKLRNIFQSSFKSGSLLTSQF